MPIRMEGMTELPEIKTEIKAEDFGGAGESSPASQTSSQNAAVSTTSGNNDSRSPDDQHQNAATANPSSHLHQNSEQNSWVGNAYYLLIRQNVQKKPFSCKSLVTRRRA